MTDEPSPRLILGIIQPVNLARVALVFLPLVPGLVFFFVGFGVDPLWPAQDQTPAMEIAYARAATRAHQIYQAAAVTFFAGTLGTMAVLWKILRTRPEEEDASSKEEEL